MTFTINGGVFGHSLLRAMFGELGDKTFFLTAMLAAWCPWDGIRGGGGGAKFQQCLVFVGGYLALAARITLLATLADPNFHSWAFEVLACVLMALMGLKAWIGLRNTRADAEGPAAQGGKRLPADPEVMGGTVWNNPFGPGEPATGDPAPAAVEETPWNKEAFPFVPVGASPYGSAGEVSADRADGLLSQRISDGFLAGVLAFVSSFLLNFVVEADDKSEGILRMAGRRGADTAFGAIVGVLPAMALAVFIGFVLERQLNTWQILSAVTGITLALTLCSLSQALQHLTFLDTSETAYSHELQMLQASGAGAASAGAR